MGISVDLDRRIHSHPTEEVLEEFALDRLPDALAAQVEEHLLICRRCQDSVTQIDRFVTSLRAYANQQDLRSEPVSLKWRGALHALPKLAMSGVGAAAVVVLATIVLVLVRPSPPDVSSPVAVGLSSMRGGAELLSVAPSGKPLELDIDAPGINPERGPFEVQIVQGTGQTIWKGAARQSSGKLTARPTKPLLQGTYWVRLYGRESDLLGEFGVTVK